MGSLCKKPIAHLVRLWVSYGKSPLLWSGLFKVALCKPWSLRFLVQVRSVVGGGQGFAEILAVLSLEDTGLQFTNNVAVLLSEKDKGLHKALRIVAGRGYGIITYHA